MSPSDFRVVSSARKLVLVPKIDAPVVSFPDGAEINSWGANNETPTVVVCNGTEETPSWQGVDAVTGFVIVNEVPEEIAEAALAMYESGNSLEDVLAYLVENGCVDQYTSSWSFKKTKLSVAGTVLSDKSGIYKRDDRDLIACWREGDTFFTAPSGEGRVIEPGILQRTYRLPDGSQIDLDQVPEK